MSARPYLVGALAGAVAMAISVLIMRVNPRLDWIVVPTVVLLLAGWLVEWWMFLRAWIMLLSGAGFDKRPVLVTAMLISGILGPGACLGSMFLPV